MATESTTSGVMGMRVSDPAVLLATMLVLTGCRSSAPDRSVDTAPGAALAGPRDAATDCAPASSGDALTGDVDGDGRLDLVAHQWTTHGAMLTVCTADGRTYQLEGMGQAELLRLVDGDGDGTTEILYGATTVAVSGQQVAVWSDDGLRTVTTRNGDALFLEAGGDGSFDEDRGWTVYRQIGCRDLDADGQDELVQATARRDGDGYRVTLVGYVIDGAVATETVTQSATVTGVDDLDLDLTTCVVA